MAVGGKRRAPLGKEEILGGEEVSELCGRPVRLPVDVDQERDAELVHTGLKSALDRAMILVPHALCLFGRGVLAATVGVDLHAVQLQRDQRWAALRRALLRGDAKFGERRADCLRQFDAAVVVLHATLNTVREVWRHQLAAMRRREHHRPARVIARRGN
eukprot:CAMPEP_0117573992 /NCGR_PEP_ID=MMETSP0784-20121206/61304_1 /TAXON_ID=39447 /ORGANISM="" /LENGTH=158 /DNA_ID=CAMNT_0005372703 /DNA_START=290 /DNA_END=767 /DNA_ORIENTATION=-